ncbi:MAG: DUF6179 domain-containing protein [Lachnospiraceae bacterium]|nr:DUF6179 domain-containing protein [Lachnospiraceae bacterium]
MYQMEELLPLVGHLTAKYTSNESTSVTYETAQRLMEAVLYCIRETEQGGEAAMSPVPAESRSAAQTYELGQQMVLQKVQKLRKLYHHMLGEFQDYGMKSLDEVVRKGIPEFLRRYDVRFSPQETWLTLDYPILLEHGDLSGIDEVLLYLQCLVWEQRFLDAFDSTYVTEILREWNAGYEEMYENICSIVLLNTMGHLLLQKPLQERGYTGAEYERMENLWRGRSQEELEQILRKLLKGWIASAYHNDQRLLYYLYNETGNAAARICNALYNHCLNRIFIL